MRQNSAPRIGEIAVDDIAQDVHRPGALNLRHPDIWIGNRHVELMRVRNVPLWSARHPPAPDKSL